MSRMVLTLKKIPHTKHKVEEVERFVLSCAHKHSGFIMKSLFCAILIWPL